MRYLLFVFIIGASSIQGACNVSDEPINLGMAQSCDVADFECSINTGKYSLTLKLGPTVKPLIPFATVLTITSSKSNVQNVVVDFRMVDMDMGLNRYRLTQSGNVWTGNATLPVCIASRTDWLAVVEFVDAGKRYIASFPFHTDAN